MGAWSRENHIHTYIGHPNTDVVDRYLILRRKICSVRKCLITWMKNRAPSTKKSIALNHELKNPSFLEKRISEPSYLLWWAKIVKYEEKEIEGRKTLRFYLKKYYCTHISYGTTFFRFSLQLFFPELIWFEVRIYVILKKIYILLVYCFYFGWKKRIHPQK